MAFRKIPYEIRIEAIKECVNFGNTKEIATKYGLSEATLISDCNDLLDGAEEMLKKRNLVGKIIIRIKKMYQRLTRL